MLLLGLVLGCGKLSELTRQGNASGTSNTSTEKPAGESAAAPSEFAPSSDAKADIDKLGDRFMSRSSFRANMTGEGETPVRTELEFVSPDRYRIKSGNAMEMIVIGKNTWMRMGGKWQKMPMKLDSTIEDMRAAFNKEGRQWFNEVKYTGDDAVDGKPAYVYTYHGKGPSNIGENDSRLWVGKADGLPIKIESVYRTGNLKTLKIEYDYETSVTIEPPVK